MSQDHINRRHFLNISLGSSLIVITGRLRPLLGQDEPLEVTLNSRYATGQWFYDPFGLFVNPGQTVRWTTNQWGATVTAFHPDHDNHELRMPPGARPFDSPILGNRHNTSFDYTFEVEGTYDYYSRYQEVLGMIGRIVVGRPGGPGERPLGYGGSEGRAPIYRDMRTAFEALNSQEIVQKKVVPFPQDLLVRKFPYRP
ncbi:hypothetical protein MYX82_08345 [Acidobacteria bacterium AH-259-D05]|nr:hypothetical protein [Acidobacteria bacterium AH-259-D05]